MDKEELLKIIEEIEAIADDQILVKLERLKTLINKVPKGKAVHRFNKRFSEMPLYIDYQGVKATVFWEKNHQIRILKGANLKKDFILTAKGEKSFSDKFGETLRIENQQAIQDYILIEDVILKSVNEVGLFLYFGGVNSWEVLMNEQGETLDELSKK
ncbi:MULTISPECIES: hypothetical protein [unclassified Enterococcus]|uniref:hypothetical protein n=1 Tax=unclassified Enterococcus TaxID=2608891 RepID=UPI0015540F11|nr:MULTISPECIES: hypothetical protein [unclassified Enterococcus]MBS7576433.1 hypothetical protein [Enterococcus sp. MMGLQ5-2]MBS7583665.1 hypothetical protein [Enterococcus sp. MMGLQ5-1]NPD11526.1 hypothetical protein [Enterococcus sp. MMGLQ5-1]NPD36270.1 hypothetical protein [Enterococcus sp. MMGLQ5-2]